ncbi:MAG TPA: type 1 glutamine amidotransferase [Galbitalea sp.]|jgi:GMP synthase (glutamine-hydrolysing)|nr:type 1 glutamine amidotransferase [Galbitalea sp.]
MARSVLILQHVPWERPGILGEVLSGHGLTFETRSFLYGPAAPPLSEISGLAVLGGPMDALDYVRNPGLKVETDLVRAVADAGIPLLGICLGHQIVASALGAKLHVGVTNEVGIGTVDVVADDPVLGASGSVSPVLHWHHDVVEVPDGATVLASTSETPNQAFRLGSSILAMQFHLEVDKHMLERWLGVDEMADDLSEDTLHSIGSDFAAVAPRMRETADRAFDEFALSVLMRD